MGARDWGPPDSDCFSPTLNPAPGRDFSPRNPPRRGGNLGEILRFSGFELNLELLGDAFSVRLLQQLELDASVALAPDGCDVGVDGFVGPGALCFDARGVDSFSY